MFKQPKTKIDWIDELGSWSGVTAALLIASNIGAEGFAFPIFLLSCGSYVYIARVKNLSGMTRMNVIFFFINLWGVWRWVIQPWLGM